MVDDAAARLAIVWTNIEAVEVFYPKVSDTWFMGDSQSDGLVWAMHCARRFVCLVLGIEK